MRKRLVEKNHSRLSVLRQCELLDVNRNRLQERRERSEEELRLRREIVQIFVESPVYGTRQMTRALRRLGWCVGRKRVRRAMREMGLAPIYPRPRTSIPAIENKVFLYLLRDLTVDRPDHVWCSDITYIPMKRGAYLVVIMDWATRSVLD